MDYRYCKRPVTIEAFQMTKERRWSNSEWPDWLHEAWQKDQSEPNSFWCDKEFPEELFITTLERAHSVSYYDWIIQGVNGELYPCKPDIFELTYETPATTAAPDDADA